MSTPVRFRRGEAAVTFVKPYYGKRRRQPGMLLRRRASYPTVRPLPMRRP